MAKAHSAKSSTVGSIRHPSPGTNNDQNAAPEPQQSGKEASQFTPPNVEMQRESDGHLQSSHPEGSQPMTASISTSSHPSTKDATSVGGSGAIPYGTRSRNRAGASRPNYAEDTALDAEFELAPPVKEIKEVKEVKEGHGRKNGRAADTSSNDAGRSDRPAKNTPGLEPEQIHAPQSHHKDPIPGTSTFSANPSISTALPTIQKKRKAANQAAASKQQLQMQPQYHQHVQCLTRRESLAAQVVGGIRLSNMYSFEECQGRLKDGKLVSDDGTVFQVNDHVYLVCEPPGEPYYLGRIMEFLYINNDTTQYIDALRLNWYYRPKEIGRKVNDTRQVFASMHSDVSPLTALRGKCVIKHKTEAGNLNELRNAKDSFWYEKLYDRYIQRYYDVVPTSQVINVPVDVKKVLDERWRYIIVEPGRGKELTSASKSCKRCNKYCATNDSVDCAVCRQTYHMSCVNPPLLKKPSRGFAWACGPCSKAQEKKLEARHTPNLLDPNFGAEEEEGNEEDESSAAPAHTAETDETSPTVSNEADVSFNPGNPEQIRQASMWLYRYLGIHCKVEDALDYDDRIYPRASSRLGPRHQAVVPVWPGRPVEYVKPKETKRKYNKSGPKKDVKPSKDAVAALEALKRARENRPKWVMDEPVGYIHRGEDYTAGDPKATSQLLYKAQDIDDFVGSTPSESKPPGQISDLDARDRMVEQYMIRAAHMSIPLGLPQMSTNILDIALELYLSNEYNAEKALAALQQTDRKVFKEPNPSGAELKRFEDGVAKYGSEWHSIKKHVKTMKPGEIVRFYYTWKKTERGRQVWENFSGRKGKKEAKRSELSAGKLQDDVADEHDDSAFDNIKASAKKRQFQCKFCSTKSSRQWRRAPHTAAGTMISDNGKMTGKDKGNLCMVALCLRCAELWRRYAIQWEDIEEFKKAAMAGGRAWKRKIDEETLKELQTANELNHIIDQEPYTSPAAVSANGTPGPLSAIQAPAVEPPRKKQKSAVASERQSADAIPVEAVHPAAPAPKKKPVVEKPPPPPPPPPEPPKARQLPCAICGEMDPVGELLTCKECRMTVHRNCYGVVGENRSSGKWVCDMCSNDRNPQVSIHYKCMLCPVESTEHDFVEPPKVVHKKKSEKDRERDRVEREKALEVAEYFRKRQEELNKPTNPREPLKRTANNNWVHVICAVFTPEVKFGSAPALEPSEGIPSIPTARYDETCKVCKKNKGACVSCHQCRASVHVGCAHQAGYVLGFDIVPVKGSRRDQFNIVTLAGESGTMTAAIWCKEHVPTKTIVHRMHDKVDETGLNALQIYVRNFKQADLTLTGTVRKATLVNQSTKVANTVSAAPVPNRRFSTTNTNGSSGGRGSISHPKAEEGSKESLPNSNGETAKICVTCEIDVSPKWWPFPAAKIPAVTATIAPAISRDLANGAPLTNGNTRLPSIEDNGGIHIALAAAALHQNSVPVRRELQCHQCHFKRVQRKEPTPQLPPAVVPRELSRPPPSIPPTPSSSNISPPNAEVQPAHPNPYWPPQPPSYPSNGNSYNWLQHSPSIQSVPLVNQLNGNHSPHGMGSNMPSHNGQPPMRQTVHGLTHSPHQNGHPAQLGNGYPLSPRHNMSSAAIHMQNGTHASYASTRPNPTQLINGGPPPRADHPFMHNMPPMHRHASYGPTQGSPPMHREPPPQHRDSHSHSHGHGYGHEIHSRNRDPLNPQSNGARPNEGRGTGASASMSLQNLLS